MGCNGVGFMRWRSRCAIAKLHLIGRSGELSENKMPLKVECIVDSGMHTEESLGGAR